MKNVVIGGTGPIETKVVKQLTEHGHEALAASPHTGVDATTGRGLDEALARAQVVVDVSNSPSFEDTAVLAFFESSGRNLARAVRQASVRHHVALSVVGTDRLKDSGYFRAKLPGTAIRHSLQPWGTRAPRACSASTRSLIGSGGRPQPSVPGQEGRG